MIPLVVLFIPTFAVNTVEKICQNILSIHVPAAFSKGTPRSLSIARRTSSSFGRVGISQPASTAGQQRRKKDQEL
jgi:hypothetical protein